MINCVASRNQERERDVNWWKKYIFRETQKLVELAKGKHNALDVTEINNFFTGDDLSTEQMEQIYSYLETTGSM